MVKSDRPATDDAANADREILLTRVFDAPRVLVYRMWTEREHVAKWWGPFGFQTTIRQMDVRLGGVWRLVMHGPDGHDYHNRVVFLEVAPPERLVFEHQPDAACERSDHRTEVTFVELPARGGRGQTEVTLRMIFSSAEERNRVVEQYGALEGGKQTLARLAEHLARQAAGACSSEPGSLSSGADPALEGGRKLVLTRELAAPRELVYRLWTEAAHLAAWWGPKGFTTPECEVDARPGGAIWMVMRSAEGVDYPMTGEFRELSPPERLVFVTSPVDAARRPLAEILNTITFADVGGKTLLTLTAEVLQVTPTATGMIAGMRQGWSESLDRLAALAAKSA